MVANGKNGGPKPRGLASSPTHHVAIIGAGIGGLACAARLAAAGCAVTVFESQPTLGGKMRQIEVGGLSIDSGPTVLTMRWVFEELFAACGQNLDDALALTPLATLARHAWPDGTALDLFADRARSADAIAAFAGPAEARGYRDFCDRARKTYEALEASFIRAPRPTPLSLVQAAGLRGLPGLARISPFATLWRAVSDHFADPRLRQLFGRYATYCGASPFAAPATLMLVAHVEQEGVWSVAGGLHALAQAVAALATRHGATVRTSAPVAEILTAHGRAAGIRLATGETIAADAVVLNADQAALAAGLFGHPLCRLAPGAPHRSLSALTWSIAGTPEGFPLQRHNVFFSADYQAEFAAIAAGRLPAQATAYACWEEGRPGALPLDQAAAEGLRPPFVCERRGVATPRHSQTNGGLGPLAPVGVQGAKPLGLPSSPQPLFVITNAPANGDSVNYAHTTDAATAALHRLFHASGLDLTCHATTITTPTDFARLFPATGGALYGMATHGAMASFRRPGARTALPGLYLAGGSVHPGPGVPMAALSGAQAAASLLADGVSTSLSRKTATAGGISTRSATTAPTP